MNRLVLVVLASLIAGCALTRSPSEPFDTITVPGLQLQPRALVVVLPGFIYDAQDLKDFGVADAIHRGWPEADVILTSATMQYYLKGVLAERVHRDVIEPARRQGYTDIWLTGGSLGGAGVMLYEWAHPRELTGIALFSPALGADEVIDPIREAGGVDRWNPGPVPAQMDGDNWDFLLWTMIKGWTPQQTRGRVWVACGTDDPLFADVRLLEPKLPSAQYFARPGDHDWDFWLPMLTEVFGKIAQQRRQAR
jgi:hypothetical protein